LRDSVTYIVINGPRAFTALEMHQGQVKATYGSGGAEDFVSIGTHNANVWPQMAQGIG